MDEPIAWSEHEDREQAAFEERVIELIARIKLAPTPEEESAAVDVLQAFVDDEIRDWFRERN